MPDYAYYTDTYMGCLIPEKAFGRVIRQAAATLDWLDRHCAVSGGQESRAMALCAMAEECYRQQRRGSGVAAATVGEMSVRYQAAEDARSLAKLCRQAEIYLDIYRGKG